MIRLQQYEKPHKSLTAPKFTYLQPNNGPNSVSPSYLDNEKKNISFVTSDSLDEVKIIDKLHKMGMLLNFAGVLEKDGLFFLFYQVDTCVNLQNYAQQLEQNNFRLDEKFCIEYFQSFMCILNELHKMMCFIKVITPDILGFRNRQNSCLGFGLLLPFPCKFINCLLKAEYEQNIRYVAPEIIRLFQNNPSMEACQKQFRKAGLFSLGMVLLRCFGYVFTPKQRIQAARNDKQFRIIFKKIRKQIKLHHNGKFVPKVFKLLLEDCEKSRQILPTFAIKLKSAQFQSLKTNQNKFSLDLQYFTTLSDTQNLTLTAKSMKDVIEINIISAQNTVSPISQIDEVERKELQKSEVKSNNFERSLRKTGKMDNLLQNDDGPNSPIQIQIQEESFEDVWNTNYKPNPNPRQRKLTAEFKREQIADFNNLSQDQEIKALNQECLNIIEKTNKSSKKQQNNTHQISLNPQKTKKCLPVNVEHQPYVNLQQIYQYKENERKIGRMNQHKLIPMNNPSILLSLQNVENEVFDTKSILRRKFDNESKLIMGTILLSFFLYGLVGYLRQRQ